MPRVSKAKLDILRRVQGGAVLGAKNGMPYWVGSKSGPIRENVKELVAADLLALLNPNGHAMSTGQRFSVTDEGAALLVEPEPEPEPEPEDEAEDESEDAE